MVKIKLALKKAELAWYKSQRADDMRHLERLKQAKRTWDRQIRGVERDIRMMKRVM